MAAPSTSQSSTVDGAPTLLSCSYCTKTMGSLGIKCTECEDFVICLPCFSLGAETSTHRKSHDYSMIGSGHCLLFDSPIEWTAAETLALLDGVENHGFGNWDNVAKSVPSKTPEECASFFIQIFIEGNLCRVFNANRCDFSIGDHSTNAIPISMLPPVEMTAEEKRELGYYPLRDDFELEYDHDAEKLVSDLVFRADDDEDQVAYKCWKIDQYRLRLSNRIRHKRVARDFGLVKAPPSSDAPPASVKAGKSSAKEANDSSSSNDVYSDFQYLKPISRYKSAQEMKLMVENMKKEKQLRDRIKRLSAMKRKDITKLKDEKLTSPKREASPTKKARFAVDTKEEIERNSPNRPESPIRTYSTRSSTASPVHQYDDYGTDLADMMTERERKICHSMKMTYRQYFSAKTAILKDYLARRRGVPVKLRYPPGLDPSHRRKIIGLMTDSGWLDEDDT